jgi:uncharacterized protein
VKTRDVATISAMVARKKVDTIPLPVILQYTIYVRDKGQDLRTIKDATEPLKIKWYNSSFVKIPILK